MFALLSGSRSGRSGPHKRRPPPPSAEGGVHSMRMNGGEPSKQSVKPPRNDSSRTTGCSRLFPGPRSCSPISTRRVRDPAKRSRGGWRVSRRQVSAWTPDDGGEQSERESGLWVKIHLGCGGVRLSGRGFGIQRNFEVRRRGRIGTPHRSHGEAQHAGRVDPHHQNGQVRLTTRMVRNISPWRSRFAKDRETDDRERSGSRDMTYKEWKS